MTAATVYPGAIDTFDTPGATLAGAPLHSDLHKHLASAVRAIEVALGINPDVLAVDPSKCDARLTFTSGTAITTADVLAAANVYVTPHNGNKMALYDGSSAWVALTFTELTQSLAALVSGDNVDVFAYNNAGAVATELLAWTNSTTRATALVRQNGILVKSGATTRRYLGTIYANGTGTSEDSAKNRLLWNNYNRVPRRMHATETTASWAYASGTLRGANNSTLCRLNMVVGVSEDEVNAYAKTIGTPSASYETIVIAIGLDSTTASAGAGGMGILVNGYNGGAACRYDGLPGVGFHYLQQLEACQNGTSITFRGSGLTPLVDPTSIHGRVMA